MEKRNGLGPQRIPAAILIIWGLLYTPVQMLVTNILQTGGMSISALGWISRLCSLGLIVLLFAGKRTVWFMVFSLLQTLLSAWNLVNIFNTYNIIWLVTDVVMLVIVLFAALPSLSGNRNPFKNLEFIPACLDFLPFILIFFANLSSRNSAPYGAMYYANAVISSLALWCTARALTADSAPKSAPSPAAYATYVPANTQPPPVRPAPQPAASAADGPSTLLVRFSIDKLNKLSGSYGYQSGKLIGQVVPPSLLEGMTISDGDSAATLQGREYVCIVSISTPSKRLLLKEQIEPRIAASEQVKACGALPLTQLVSSSNEPLVADGIVRNGRIEGPGGWCASGFMSVWKELSEA